MDVSERAHLQSAFYLTMFALHYLLVLNIRKAKITWHSCPIKYKECPFSQQAKAFLYWLDTALNHPQW